MVAHGIRTYEPGLRYSSLGVKIYSREAGIYAQNIQAELYAVDTFPILRFGHNTLDIFDRLNRSCTDIRGITPLHMLCSIWWSKVMETVANRQYG